MFAFLTSFRKAARPVAALAAAAALAACDASLIGPNVANTANTGGPSIEAGAPVPVAFLVPQSDPGAAPVARSLENAARLAMADLGDVRIDLRVYDTGGNAATAAAQAQKAVDEGAKIILGPLFSEAANAAGTAVADEGVNVLSFSNTTAIAGGNVFILGSTFANTANRLMAHARKQGKKSVVIVHANDVAGQFGEIAIQQAATVNGMQVVSSEGYEMEDGSIRAAAQRAAATVKAGQADTIFVTADPAQGDFPRLMTYLPENGVAPGEVQYVGLIRFDTITGSYDYPGSDGAWFALPDVQSTAAFNQRYASTYGAAPHPLASLAYDGISAVGLLAKRGQADALTGKSLTSASFTGTGGVFRLLKNGTNQRALAIATVQNKQMVILDSAPSSLSGTGF
jgi:ABC-type branched-subunit amino acid transport system substrate-binding protein